ncbi:hypothetical protein HDU76_014012 [Blyttiomyces sp. JEL0837]|nr:hypothetical protein HDU76_014012 [Blyttiomyces sp. JEL0837]
MEFNFYNQLLTIKDDTSVTPPNRKYVRNDQESILNVFKRGEDQQQKRQFPTGKVSSTTTTPTPTTTITPSPTSTSNPSSVDYKQNIYAYLVFCFDKPSVIINLAEWANQIQSNFTFQPVLTVNEHTINLKDVSESLVCNQGKRRECTSDLLPQVERDQYVAKCTISYFLKADDVGFTFTGSTSTTTATDSEQIPAPSPPSVPAGGFFELANWNMDVDDVDGVGDVNGNLVYKRGVITDTADTTGTGSGDVPTSITSSNNQSSSTSQLNPGALAGIALAALAVVAIATLAVVLVVRRNRNDSWGSKTQNVGGSAGAGGVGVGGYRNSVMRNAGTPGGNGKGVYVEGEDQIMPLDVHGNRGDLGERQGNLQNVYVRHDAGFLVSDSMVREVAAVNDQNSYSTSSPLQMESVRRVSGPAVSSATTPTPTPTPPSEPPGLVTRLPSLTPQSVEVINRTLPSMLSRKLMDRDGIERMNTVNSPVVNVGSGGAAIRRVDNGGGIVSPGGSSISEVASYDMYNATGGDYDGDQELHFLCFTYFIRFLVVIK